MSKFSAGEIAYVYGKPVTILGRAAPPHKNSDPSDVWYRTEAPWWPQVDKICVVWEGRIQTREEAIADKLRSNE